MYSDCYIVYVVRKGVILIMRFRVCIITLYEYFERLIKLLEVNLEKQRLFIFKSDEKSIQVYFRFQC